MKPRPLRDEELSRVLSAAAVGELWHGALGRRDDDVQERPPWFPQRGACACIAGTALNLHSYDSEFGYPSGPRVWQINAVVARVAGVRQRYGGTPDRVLANLRRAGLVRP